MRGTQGRSSAMSVGLKETAWARESNLVFWYAVHLRTPGSLVFICLLGSPHVVCTIRKSTSTVIAVEPGPLSLMGILVVEVKSINICLYRGERANAKEHPEDFRSRMETLSKHSLFFITVSPRSRIFRRGAQHFLLLDHRRLSCSYSRLGRSHPFNRYIVYNMIVVPSDPFCVLCGSMSHQ